MDLRPLAEVEFAAAGRRYVVCVFAREVATGRRALAYTPWVLYERVRTTYEVRRRDGTTEARAGLAEAPRGCGVLHTGSGAVEAMETVPRAALAVLGRVIRDAVQQTQKDERP